LLPVFETSQQVNSAHIGSPARQSINESGFGFFYRPKAKVLVAKRGVPTVRWLLSWSVLWSGGQ